MKQEQVVVVIADGATGIILNCKGERYRNDSLEDIYWLFENINMARDFVKNQSLLNDKKEFIIYDKNQNIIELFEATHWKK